MVSIVLFVLVGAGHLLPAFHFALVVHRVCSAHGELVHGEAGADAPGREPDGIAWVALERGHEHEHCGVAAATGAGVAIAPSAASGSTPPSAMGLARHGDRAPHVGIALLAYAPKLAPPANVIA